jgi:hypothetical protein
VRADAVAGAVAVAVASVVAVLKAGGRA